MQQYKKLMYINWSCMNLCISFACKSEESSVLPRHSVLDGTALTLWAPDVNRYVRIHWRHLKNDISKISLALWCCFLSSLMRFSCGNPLQFSWNYHVSYFPFTVLIWISLPNLCFKGNFIGLILFQKLCDSYSKSHHLPGRCKLVLLSSLTSPAGHDALPYPDIPPSFPWLITVKSLNDLFTS